jgi:hypothetical protein
MSLNANWIAVATDDCAAVLSDLGLVETGELNFSGDLLDGVATLPGWTIVFGRDLDIATDETMRRLSAHWTTLGCQMSDVSMFSVAFGYEAGEQVWRVGHDPEETDRPLEAHGRLPAQFDAIRDAALRRQSEDADADVDDIFDVPLDLVGALCGCRPDANTLPAGVVFRVVERARQGKAGERQAAQRSLRERSNGGVRGQLFPAAERLGFEPLLRHPAFHQYYAGRTPNTFVRFRGDRAECIEFSWGLPEGAPGVAVNFFVRTGAEPRYGRAGQARVPPRPLNLMERFTGRKQDPDAAVDQAVADGLERLDAVDRHLREGAPHPRLSPADYLDQGAG